METLAVWIVIAEETPYDSNCGPGDWEIIGVYSTEEKADKAISEALYYTEYTYDQIKKMIWKVE
jgi:hypothetical protein